ncbi:efflux RND transporter permease subunit, partial [Arthrospira platensis SPKY1]|nr:efflux RND transporter permease subunit [Arthrospira platensis SPKY1]
LTDIADNVLKTRFETISGVGRVDIWGSKEYAMRLWLEPERMAAHGVTATDVRNAFARANVELPSGRLEGRTVDVNIRTDSRLDDDPERFNDRVIMRNGERVVRLRDIGSAEIGPLNERTILKRDGVPMVGLVIRPQPNANEIAIVDEFYRRLAIVERELPEDVRVQIGFDT